jgi:hypothetical protein
MKIITDSTWGKIYDEDDNILLSLDKYEYAKVITNILNNTQQMRYVNSDGIFKLSKKAEIYLLQYIKTKQPKTHELNAKKIFS